MADIKPTPEDTPNDQDRPSWRQVYKADTVLLNTEFDSQSVSVPNPTKLSTFGFPSAMPTAEVAVHSKVHGASAVFGPHQKDGNGGPLVFSHVNGVAERFPTSDLHSVDEIMLVSDTVMNADRTVEIRFQ